MKNLPTLVLVLLLLLVCWLGLTGCDPRELRSQAAQGSQLVLTTLSDPKTFNYALVQEFPNIGLFSYEGLTRENGITGQVEPALAESWSVSPDQREITFTLRPGLKWSDGMPLTAADVVFTYEKIIFNPQIPTDASDSLRIGLKRQFPRVQQLDERRVLFRLPEPFAPFLRAAAGPPSDVAILPKHKLAETIDRKDKDGNPRFIRTWGTDTHPRSIVVNGPYLIESYTPSQRVIFRRNPHYWRKDAQGQPLPYIDRIVWQVMESPDTQLLNLRTGDLDVMGDVRPLRPEYFTLLKQEENRRQLQVLNGGPWSGTTFLSFNLNRGRNAKGEPLVDPIKSRWFTNLAFRQAVAYGINRQQIVDNIFRGVGVLQNSPISVQSPFFRHQGLPVYNYDPERAQELLQSAGFRYRGQQLLDADGNRVRFTLLTNVENRLRVAIGAQIKQDLSKLGIQVDFNPIPFNTLVDRLTASRDWDAHLIGFTGGVDPHGQANLYMSTGGSHNFNLGPQPGQPPIQGWQASAWEQDIDRLFIAGARELDEGQRKEIYGEFQKLVQTQLPVIFLVNEVALMAVQQDLAGLQYSGLPSWGLWNIAEIKLERNRRSSPAAWGVNSKTVALFQELR